MSDPLCSTCEAGGSTRYCAPARCYCGHDTCHAFASFVDMTRVPVHDTTPTKPRDTGWNDREGESWLERL
jgi:hypothetical protein